MKTLHCVSCLFAVGFAALSCADDTPVLTNLTAPRSSALAILGLDASTVKSPTSFTQLGLILFEGSDNFGSFSRGFSLSSPLYYFSPKNTFSYESLRENYFDRLLKLSQLSLASTLPGGENGPYLTSAGWSFSLIDRTQWQWDDGAVKRYTQMVVESRAEYIDLPVLVNWDTPAEMKAALPDSSTKLGKALEKLGQERYKTLSKYKGVVQEVRKRVDTLYSEWTGSNENITEYRNLVQLLEMGEGSSMATQYQEFVDAESAFRTERVKKDIDKFVEAERKARWNAEKIDLSFAAVFASEDKSWSKLANSGTYAWLSATTPFGKDGRLSGMYQMISSARTWDADTKQLVKRGTGFQGGIQLAIGSTDNSFFAEYLFGDKAVGGTSDKTVWRLGYEFNWGGQWVQIYGGSQNDGSQKGKALFGLNFSFNRGSEKKFVF